MSAGRKATLAELMGTAGANGSLSLSQLPDLLGESMPELPKNPVGRHRLIRSLQQRFGVNYRSLPGVKDLVAEFDAEIAHEIKVAKLKAIRYKPSEKKHG